jgi:hypothetical protein
MLKFRFLSLVFMLMCILSCTEEDSEVILVTTEEVLFASGDEIRLLGRVISNQELSLVDHGFYVSEDASFSSPAIVSLGEKDGPGRFIGQLTGLRVGRPYFAKAFMDRGAEIEFGNVLELSTLEPAIIDFSPKFGAVGEEILIEGRNFGADTRVFFGGQEAQVIENTLQSRLRVRVPIPEGNRTVPIRVVVQDREVSLSESFEYQIGTYEKIGTFPESIRVYDNVFFQDGPNRFFIGLGSERRLVFLPGFQRYDRSSSTWQEVAFPGASRSFAFSTDHYIGGGLSQLGSNPFVYEGSFWGYENGAFTRLPDLPFLSRDAIAFELGEDLYVLGKNPDTTKFFFRFDKSEMRWELLPTPEQEFTRNDAVFTYQGNAYLIDSLDGTIWRYNLNSGAWDSIGTYPGSLGNGRGMARVIGDKAFIGLFERSDQVFELDLNSFSWKPKNPMPGLPQSVIVGHFVSGESLYIMRVPDITLAGQFPMDFYRFDPDGI